MVFSTPVLRPKSHPSSIATQLEISNLDDYLRQINNTLSNLNLKLNHCHIDSIAQLKQTLIRLEVAQIKHSAIKEKVGDFYPTPGAVIDKMLTLAELRPHHHVLEPSAGSGDLAYAIALSGVANVDCFELHPLLQKALILQGFNVIERDFLTSKPLPVYDRVIANPPFGNNGVAHHTTHAFKFLKSGGRLISLAHHYQLKPSHTDKAFFAWLSRNNARFLNCGQAFKNSDRKTHVPLQIILLTKP